VRRGYYFLAASLPDLFRGRTSGAGSLEEYLDYCETQVTPEDFDTLKQLFLFNDARNAVTYRSKEDSFVSPSFYSAEQMLKLIDEPESFFPFLRRYAATRIEEQRERPELTEIDELISYFYEALDDVADDFVREYYANELELRNIGAAFELRAGEFELAKYLIPLGRAYELIMKNPEANDLGLSVDFPYARNLYQLYDEADLTKREEMLDQIRWQWLDERVGADLFSLNFLAAYAIKLASVERWSSLSVEKGEELFQDLLDTVRRSVRFEIEFAHLTEEQKAERRRQLEEERRRAQNTEQTQSGEESR